MSTPIPASRMLRVLTDLQASTDKLWRLVNNSAKLNDIVTDDEFIDYWKYYKEIMPFVRDFATQANNDEISRLANKFCKENFLNVEKAMNGRYMDDFREAFNETKYTLDNLAYQLKIY